MTPRTHHTTRLARTAKHLLLTVAGCSLPLHFALTKPIDSGQTYRCVSADGAMTYSQRPCQTQSDLLDTRDNRTAAQIKQAHALIVRDVKLAKTMQTQRQREEKRASKIQAKALTLPSGKPAKIYADATQQTKRATAQADTSTLKRYRPFTAMVPKSSSKAASKSNSRTQP